MSCYFDEHDCVESEGRRNESIDLLLLARMVSRQEGIVELNDVTSLDELQGPPASKKVVEELPRKIIKYTPTEKPNCPICLENCEKKDVFIELPCQHIFHKDCIMLWFNKTNSCPVCRHELPTDNPEYEELRLRKLHENDQHHRLESLHSAMFC